MAALRLVTHREGPISPRRTCRGGGQHVPPRRVARQASGEIRVPRRPHVIEREPVIAQRHSRLVEETVLNQMAPDMDQRGLYFWVFLLFPKAEQGLFEQSQPGRTFGPLGEPIVPRPPAQRVARVLADRSPECPFLRALDESPPPKAVPKLPQVPRAIEFLFRATQKLPTQGVDPGPAEFVQVVGAQPAQVRARFVIIGLDVGGEDRTRTGWRCNVRLGRTALRGPPGGFLVDVRIVRLDRKSVV